MKLKKSDAGILICGSGTGMAITAKKSKELEQQFAIISNYTISRQHNNANSLLGSRLTKIRFSKF